MTNRSCGTCHHAEPSESLHGFVLCGLNVAAAGQGRTFIKKCFNLSPTLYSCGAWSARETPLVFPERAAAPVAERTEQKEAFVQVTGPRKGL